MSGEGLDAAALADVVAGLRRAMRRAARTVEPASHLSVAQLELLSCVAERPRARPGEIAQALQLASTSVATLLTALSRKGFVQRSRNSGDRRSFAVELTQAGQDAVHRWQAVNRAILAGATASMSRESVVLLSDSLPALQELVEAINAWDASGQSEGLTD